MSAMPSTQCLVNIIIVLVMVILLTVVSSWQRGKNSVELIQLIGGWMIIISILAGAWGLIIILINAII